MATLGQTRQAQRKAEALLREQPGVNGIGISRRGKGFVLQVQVYERTGGRDLPADIDGVPVVTVEVPRSISAL